MRNLDFSELNMNIQFNEEEFYDYYLKNLPKNLSKDTEFKMPNRKYEIFYLNILGGKIILLNKKYLPKTSKDNQYLYYDYKTAFTVYNYLVDIYDGIEKESYEFTELYKNERLDKDSKIIALKQKDDELFNNDMNEYNIIINSDIYINYWKLLEENKKLQDINSKLTEENKKVLEGQCIKTISLWQKFLNKFKKNKLLNNGDENDR